MKPRIIGNCTLYQGDCFDILPKLDICVDAVISDPPFGITACNWDTAFSLVHFWELLDRRSKQSANFVLFGCGKFSIDLVNSRYSWYRYSITNLHYMPCGKTRRTGHGTGLLGVCRV